MTRKRSSPGAAEGRKGPGLAETGLVRFDRASLAVLGLLLVLLAIGTSLRLHGSSIGIWNRTEPGKNPRAGVLLGSPRVIRIDEWGFMTPAMASQAVARPAYPDSNPSWGPGRVPLIANFPVRHWSVAVRPQFWGFLALGLEHGFSFFWWMKWVLLASGVFVLLMLLTRNDFGVALLGTAWISFSGFLQWWFSTPAMLPEMVGSVAWLIVAIHYVVLSPRAGEIAIGAAVFTIALLNAALTFYPPFQVPLFYLGLAILAGSIGSRLATGPRPARLRLRALWGGAALVAVLVFLALYHRDTRATIDLMLGTVYPGSRTSTGGGVSLVQIFSGFFGPFLTEERVPSGWQNVCEASNFVLLFPVAAAALLAGASRGRRAGALEWALLSYLLLVTVWLTLGLPGPIARLTGIGLSQGMRSLLGLGLGSIVLCCVWLSRRDPAPASRDVAVIGVLAPLASLVGYGVAFQRETGAFARAEELAIVCVVGTAAAFFLLTRRRRLFAATVLVPLVGSFGLVNPLAVGLGPLLDAPLAREVSGIVRREPDARWAVYGSHVLADYFKAAGARVFNGTKFVPPLEDFRILDPRGEADSTYNRFAHITLLPRDDANVDFEVIAGDSYTMRIHPANDLWRQLGVRYVVLPVEVPGGPFRERADLVLALPEQEVWIYRYRGNSGGSGDR